MAADHTPRGGRGLVALAELLAWFGVGLIVIAYFAQDPAPPAPTSGSTMAVQHAAPIRPSRPVAITIPAIGVESSLVGLGLDSQRQLEVPSDPATAGWYVDSAAPGSVGAAVIAGHVTWNQEPTVFFKLGALRPGQRVRIQRADGRTAIFAITRVAQYSKSEFPTAQVYGKVNRPDLRLITCGGRFDDDSDTYDANVVAYGTLVASRT
jgi:sortase (surface protein transpeptidase)